MNTHRTQGYTLIETLVAITVLMLAIVGPLTVANKALTAALDARNQVIAYNLAQESMEEFKNWKDNAVAGGAAVFPLTGSETPAGTNNCQNTGTANLCGMYMATDALGNVSYAMTNCGSCNLYTNTNGYSYAPSSAATPFTRYLYATPTSSGEAYITVVVAWTAGTGSAGNQIQIQELMTNAAR